MNIRQFLSPLTLSIKGKIIQLTRPLVMGIINVTPDSFYSESRAEDIADVLKRVKTMLQEGADIIDIGACSTRPGSKSVSAEEEMRRLSTALDAIRKEYPEALLSVDTFRASVAEECLKKWDVDIINDVSGGSDPDMYRVVAKYNAGYILMHMRSTPENMEKHCDYKDVVTDVIRELAFRINKAHAEGVCNVIVDPGFGFAKDLTHNYMLLKHLEYFKVLGCPILVGVSRKRMTREGDDPSSEAAKVASIALNAVAISKGANIIRVHDVKESVATAKSIGKLWNLE